MKMSKAHRMVYLSRCYRNLTSAGNKAKTDNEATMREMGFVNVGLPQHVGGSSLFIFIYTLVSVVKACFSIRRGDMLLLQYPVKKYFSFLCHVAHFHGASVVAIIHDLGSFRRRKLTVEKEIKRLSNADCVIASNDVMESWLKGNGLKVATTALGLFDYRSVARPKVRPVGLLFRVVYAGSLNPRKNAFFLSMPSIIRGFQPHIYGNGDAMPSLKNDKRIVFHGFTPADVFIAHCDGDFGLVWDGDSLDSCTGSFGEYLRYNSPHKASFYLRAGMPVIVWRDAAIAPIIESEGIGITISSLRELANRLSAITADDMQAMRLRVAQVADKLSRGGFLPRSHAKGLQACGFMIQAVGAAVIVGNGEKAYLLV